MPHLLCRAAIIRSKLHRQIMVRDCKYAGQVCHLHIGHVICHMYSGCKCIVYSIQWTTA